MRRLALLCSQHGHHAAVQAASAGLTRTAQAGLTSSGRGLSSLLAPVAREAPLPSHCFRSNPLLSQRALSSGAAGPSGSAAGAVQANEPDQAPSQAAAADTPQPRKNLMMVYTCGQCERRSVMTMSKQSYEKGVVLVKCPGCDVTHLIADHKGWFGKPGSVEDFMAEKGEAVLRRAAVGAQAGAGAGGTIEITEEELMGWSPAKTGEGGGVAAEDAAQQQQLEAADAKGSERRG